jgi:hypothetical protein
MADSVHVLNRGVLEFSGLPDELDEHTLQQKYLGGSRSGAADTSDPVGVVPAPAINESE